MPGKAEHRFSVHFRKKGRFAGLDGNAVEQYLPKAMQHPEGVVLFPHGGATGDQDHVAFRKGCLQRIRQQGQFVLHDGVDHRVGTKFFHLGSEHDGVDVSDLGAFRLCSKFHQFVPGG